MENYAMILNAFMFIFLVLVFVFIAIIVFLVYSKEENNSNENIKKNNRVIRKHEKITKISFGSPLDPYERYIDKSTKLYEPRKQGGGIKIEEGDKE